MPNANIKLEKPDLSKYIREHSTEGYIHNGEYKPIKRGLEYYNIEQTRGR